MRQQSCSDNLHASPILNHVTGLRTVSQNHYFKLQVRYTWSPFASHCDAIPTNMTHVTPQLIEPTLNDLLKSCKKIKYVQTKMPNSSPTRAQTTNKTTYALTPQGSTYTDLLLIYNWSDKSLFTVSYSLHRLSSSLWFKFIQPNPHQLASTTTILYRLPLYPLVL